jgi:cell wall-associated NlpC family hydrolase
MRGYAKTPVSQGGNELTTRIKAFGAILLAASLLFTAVPAYAVPQSKLAQARAVKSQIDALNDRVERAAERYNIAADKHAKVLKQKRAVAKRLKKVEKRMGVVQRHLNTRANSMYRQGPMGFVDVLLGAESFEEFTATWDLLKDLNTDDASSVAELKSLRKQAKAAHKELSKKEKAAAAHAAVMRRNERTIRSQLAQRKSKLAGLEREIAALEAAEEARRARSSWSGGGGRTFPPPTRAPRSEVVSIARRYLGAPYRWAADGPNSFDCSGFTMFVYRQVGVSLPHSSRAQINCGERVSRSDLKPGDLVFFGSPIHHVGLYVGGGMMIHAPHTGAVVSYASINRSNYAGACRP